MRKRFRDSLSLSLGFVWGTEEKGITGNKGQILRETEEQRQY